MGFTEWAFVGKALGWLVLIAYMLFGFFTVNQFRHVGILRVTEAMILSLSAIIFVRICSEAIFFDGHNFNPPYRFRPVHRARYE